MHLANVSSKTFVSKEYSSAFKIERVVAILKIYTIMCIWILLFNVSLNEYISVSKIEGVVC